VVARQNKKPFDPKTKQLASVTNPATWGTYQEAIEAKFPYIGFVLAENDPYTIIDLDAPVTPEQGIRHSKILETFRSYAEVSASGAGAHIILKGRIPTGVRRDKIEVYSSARYMICTGNRLNAFPVEERQDLLTTLHKEMHSTVSVDLVEEESLQGDADIMAMGMAASNSDKFLRLCNGEWEGEYPSQSEADFALLSIIAYYTKSNKQVRRLFRYTMLGKRKKAICNDRYLNLALVKIRAQEPAPVAFDTLQQTASMLLDREASSRSPVNGSIAQSNSQADIPLPPGIVGEIAQYIYSSAIRPVQEIGLVGALGLVAGVCGRSYNISGTGLNQYLILLAGTGTGKEGIASGIDSLIAAVRPQLPTVDQFIGPSGFASGQALLRTFDEKPCFLSVIGEFGLILQQMLDPRAFGPQVMLRRVLLDLYGKSGFSKILRPNVYSDSEKNTKLVQAPCMTLLGETTPATFYDGLDHSHITEGLLPRFSIIEYTGPRPQRNPNAFHTPSQALVQRFSDFLTIILSTAQNNSCVDVCLDQDAQYLLGAFDHKADTFINNAPNDAHAQLWNRAHLKALKLAALIAVGVNPHNPIVDQVCAQWAIDFTERDVNTILSRFDKGEIGKGDQKQEADVKRAIKTYLTMPADKREQYRVPTTMLSESVIPYSFLRRKLKTLTSFKDDRRGATMAITTQLGDMIKGGVLIELSPQQVLERYNSKSPAYVLGPSW
jgi:hypothetical protein